MSGTYNTPSTKRYAKLTKGTAYPVIERYFASGELPSTFYRREGLTEHQFYKWRKCYLKDHPALASRLGLDVPPSRSRKKACKRKDSGPVDSHIPAQGSGFGRVMSGAPGHRDIRQSSSAGIWEVEHPNGVRLRIGAQTSVETVSALIAILGG